MVTLAQMAEHYNKKVPVIVKRWTEITPKKKSEFEKGVADVIGVSPAEVKRGDDWIAGVKEAIPEFESAIKGKGDKLAKNYKIAMTTD